MSQTEYTQPALYVVNSLKYLSYLAEGETPPDILLGHSVSEYVALFASGVLDFAAGLRLVAKRGALMAEARGGGMAAVLGLEAAAIEELLKEKGNRRHLPRQFQHAETDRAFRPQGNHRRGGADVPGGGRVALQGPAGQRGLSYAFHERGPGPLCRICGRCPVRDAAGAGHFQRHCPAPCGRPYPRADDRTDHLAGPLERKSAVSHGEGRGVFRYG
ncbi:acyltransferase domain-containing protein [Roseibium salinum]|nr:acyltransferase domain-containing protein [Roseibium salinum]